MKQIKPLLLLAAVAMLLGGCASQRAQLGPDRIRTAYTVPAEGLVPTVADVGWTLGSAGETK